MNHDELIEVAEAHKNGQTIQGLNQLGCWCDVTGNPIWEFWDLRVKPEPKVVPWTPDDWREFHMKKIEFDGIMFLAETWTVHGIYLHGRGFVTWETLKNLAKFIDTGLPCGKVVDK